MRQGVMITVLLCRQPRALLADESTPIIDSAPTRVA
jgi:ABC-type dipeptide/oligopeptide/nickel transport system ATPase component